MITDKEIQSFWNRFDLIIISWNLVSIFGFIFLPIALMLKYWFRVKGIWLLNDTVDGDFGDPLLLEKYGYSDKPKWFKFLWWWFRNHSWNYISKFTPSSNGSGVSEYRVLFNTTGTYTPVWLKNKGSFHLCYRSKETGEVYCRYSKVTDKVEKHFGAAGLRYKLHYKLR